jgi:folate-binding protein YgfZ
MSPSSTTLDELTLLRERAALVDRTDRGQVLVTGEDAWTFLQALVSADLDAIAEGSGAPSLLLSPQGKLDVAFRILRVGDEAWLDTDPGLGAQLAGSLHRFKIRVKAEVIDRSDSFAMLSVVGPDAASHFGDAAPSAPCAHAAFRDGVRIVRTADGVDLLWLRAALDEVAATLVADGLQWAEVDAFEAYRIERGVPRQPLDVDDRTIPQEAELELDAVSFTKGCFLGQELVCRIDSRGHVNRFLRRLSGFEGPRPVVGAEIVVDDAVVGTVTSVTADDLPIAALGYVRREVEVPGSVALRWDGGTATASVTALRD